MFNGTRMILPFLYDSSFDFEGCPWNKYIIKPPNYFWTDAIPNKKKEIECDIYSPFLFLTNFSVHSFLANNVIKFCQGRLLDFVKLQCTIFLLPTFLHKFALEELFRQIQKIPIYIATYIRQASRYEIILWKDNAPDLFYSLVNKRNTAKFYCSYVIQIVWKAKLLRGSKTYDDPNK